MRSTHRRGALKTRLLIAALTIGVAGFAAAPAGATVEKLSVRSIGSNGCPTGYAFGSYGTARIGGYDSGYDFRTFISLAAFAADRTYTAKLIWQDIAEPQNCATIVLGTFTKTAFAATQFGSLTDELTFLQFPAPSTTEGFRIYAEASSSQNLVSTPLVCSKVGGGQTAGAGSAGSDPIECPSY